MVRLVHRQAGRAGVVAVSVVFVLVAVGISIISLCAEIRHFRYPNQHAGANTSIAALPCRDDHDRAYFHALRWLLHCRRRNYATWLTGESHAASLTTTPPQMFRWSREICFGIAAVRGAGILKDWKPCCYICPVLCESALEPAPDMLEEVTFGSLSRVLRIRNPPEAAEIVRTENPTRHIVQCRRRDVLDYFRYPFRQTDDIMVESGSDGSCRILL